MSTPGSDALDLRTVVRGRLHCIVAFDWCEPRFYLAQWSQNIRDSLDVTEAVHQTLSSQSATYRLEMLEWIIVLLILLEVVMALVGM